MLNTAERKPIIAALKDIPQKEKKIPEEKVAQNIALIAPVKQEANNVSSSNNSSAPLKKDNLFISDLAKQRVGAGNNSNITEPVNKIVGASENELASSQSLLKTTSAPARTIIENVILQKKQIVQAIPSKSTIPAISNSINETSPVSENNAVASLNNNLSPYTIESVTNSFIQIRKSKKLSWQIFVTPTVSYRELRENKPFLDAARAGLAGANNSVFIYTPDINSIVTHKPDIGFQIGFSAGYPLTKSLKITTGLQFNVSKYDIKAYSAPSEVATIALNTADRSNNTVSAYTNYRNIGGYKADWLRNLYFSASIPIGLELKLIGNHRTYIGAAASVQPTYVLGNRAYLISTDYKNYAEIPSLTRKWNVNTGFEIFAIANTGTVKWRIGPQVRYQAMSSFVEKYPIKEHLFDFGLKLGIMLK
jgi:hypothetical protein